MRDAAGKQPAKLTAYESQWRNTINSGELGRRYAELHRRQALPLAEKIDLSLQRIREWGEAFDGMISVGFSGGKDSAVLLWLARQVYPELPGIFCNTGLEYPEITYLVKHTTNITTVRPKIPFHHVIRDYGWPVISKKVARGLNILRNPTGNNQNIVRLYDQGVNRFGEPVNGFKVPARWRFLTGAPFKISDRCCEIMKKRPMGCYERETGRAQMVGTMADDSKTREKIYLQTGCNAFDAKRPRSMPMGFWREQDVIECIQAHKIPYAEVYGQIIESETGGLKFSGVKSTGCIFCCFGLHMEDSPNRFQQLRESHPHLFEFCMDRLGLKGVLDFMRGNCQDCLKEKFSYLPYKAQEQMDLFRHNP